MDEKFLKKMTCPSLLHKPVTPVLPSQLEHESQIKYESCDHNTVIEVKAK